MKNFFCTGAFLMLVLTAQSQTTIYTGNGTLNSERTVRMAGNNLTFQPNTTGTDFFINGTNGNVGINTTSPTEKLHVKGNIQADYGYFNKAIDGIASFANNNDRINTCTPLSVGKLVVPNTKLGVFSIFDFPTSNFDTAPTVWLSLNDRLGMTRFFIRAKQGGETQLNFTDKSQNISFALYDDGSNNVTLTMPKGNSRVCIGTTSYTDGVDTYALSVNGNVRADRVKVYTTWADYVFEEDYKLPTLEEVEKHIKEKGHLKDIPSASNVEVNGIELGEMNKLLLQKIEELTLYMIEQDKTNKKQAELIEKLQTQVNALKTKS